MDKISYYNIDIPYQSFHLVYNTLSDSLICFTEEEYEVISVLLQNLQLFEAEYPVICRNEKIWIYY